MSVQLTRDKDGKRIYRCNRVVNGERVVMDFPCSRQGWIDAMNLDKGLYEQQVDIREEKTKDIINNNRIKGFHFYTDYTPSLTRVIGKFYLCKKNKGESFTLSRTIKTGESIEAVFQEVKMKYCEVFDIDWSKPEIENLFKDLLKRYKRQYDEAHELMFYERDKRRR